MTEIKFIHTSDWHIGALRKLDPNHLSLQKHVFNQIIEAADAVDFVLISGDIFQDSSTTVEEMLFAWEMFETIGKRKPLIVTVGNHDELEVGSFQSKYFKYLMKETDACIWLVDEPTFISLRVQDRSVGILACPWTGIKDQTEFEEYIIQHIPKDKAVDICMLHECFTGSVLDSGKAAFGGIAVPDIPGIRYFACGDIHVPQQLNLPHAWFSGAPMQYTFGDQPDKGYLLVTLQETAQAKFIPLRASVRLKTIYSMRDWTDDQSIWYSLHCSPDAIPLDRPANVKKIVPIPVKVEMALPDTTITGDTVQEKYLEIDYSEGIDQVLAELGYTAKEIETEQEYIRKLLRPHEAITNA